MKKDYILPMVKVVNVDSESLMMQTSEIGIGGNTDHFDAKHYKNSSFDNVDDEEYEGYDE